MKGGIVSFNLCDQPWIPVRNGPNVQHVSLEDALLKAQDFKRLEHPSPLVTVAVYRLLLAVLHRALKGPGRSYEAATWARNGFPHDAVAAYLRTWKHRFELFGEQAFMQVPDLPIDNLGDHWSRLSAERGSGNTSFLFNDRLREHAPAASDAVAPAEAVLHLLAHQTFALGGLMKRLGVTSMVGAPSATTAFVMASGETLLETLALNLVPYHASEVQRDSPIWERDSINTKQLEGGLKSAMRGITDRYTWQSRGVRLMQDPDGLVRFMAFGPGVAPDGDGTKEPMAASYINKDGEPRTFALREGRGMWRDFHALVPRPGHANDIRTLGHARDVLEATNQEATIKTMVFAQANDKAKVLLTRAEAFVLPAGVLGDFEMRLFVERILQHAERIGKNLEAGARTLAENLIASGERKPLGADTAKLAKNFGHHTHFWGNLETAFALFLQNLPRDANALNAQRNALEAQWVKDTERFAWAALGVAEQSAGMSAKALRAAERGRGMLAALLRRGEDPAKKPEKKKENKT